MSKEELTTKELGLGERIILQRLLGEQRGNAMTAAVVSRFITDLAFTEEEADEWGTVNVQMNTAPREFTFTSWRLKKITEMLRALDMAKGVGQEHVTLFEKFLPTALVSEDAELAEEYAAMLASQKTAEDGDMAEDPGNGTAPPQDNHAEAPHLVPVP